MDHNIKNMGDGTSLPVPEKPQYSKSPPRIIVIGAGSQGNAFGKAITESSNGIIVGVVEPIAKKRKQFISKWIASQSNHLSETQEFEDWREFVAEELSRKQPADSGSAASTCDGVFICVQDAMHKEVILGLAPLDIHIMCEKPLATNLDDIVNIYRSLKLGSQRLFAIGHVLRYSIHNILLRRLLQDDKAIGEVLAVNHTEPVGWWHFAHSFVRGNWRKASVAAPSLLTKCCHDVDLLLWLLCSSSSGAPNHTQQVSRISSSGGLMYFDKSHKPAEAGNATNCLSCNAEPSCKFSAKKIYVDGSRDPSLESGSTGWPLDTVVPDIEECLRLGGKQRGREALLTSLRQDYDGQTPQRDIDSRPWFGRCVYESDNDVCDNQTVTMIFDGGPRSSGGARVATLHMTALTKKICERYTHISGTEGEIYADSSSITVHLFGTGEEQIYHPHVADGGHGAGDGGLARQFILAIDRVKNHGEEIGIAQEAYIGCSIDEIIKSHATVFAAEEARTSQTVIDFRKWWDDMVQSKIATCDQ